MYRLISPAGWRARSACFVVAVVAAAAAAVRARFSVYGTFLRGWRRVPRLSGR